MHTDGESDRAQQADPLHKLIIARREALTAAKSGPRADSQPAAPADIWGLALSGGGIRSATFCLGLINGLAERGIFGKFDLLSTVSGGGYAAGAVGKLYNEAGVPAGKREAQLGKMDATWFVWWLRATSRYLTPRGLKDLLNAGALYLRNVLGIHLEFALAGLVLGALMAVFNMALWRVLFWWFHGHSDSLDSIGKVFQDWLSAWWLLIALPAVASVSLASGYWTIPSMPDGRRTRNEKVLALATLLVAGAAAYASISLDAFWDAQPDSALHAACGSLAVLLLFAAAGPIVARRAGGNEPVAAAAASQQAGSTQAAAAARSGALAASSAALAATRQRNRLTNHLALCINVALALFMLGAVDRVAWFFAFNDLAKERPYLLPAAIAISLGVARAFAAGAGAKQASTSVSPTVGFKLVGLAGNLLLALLVVFWVSVVYRYGLGNLFPQAPGENPLSFSAALWVTVGILLAPLLYMVFTRQNADFCNLSSLHMFYRARLTRSYLGAANAQRFAGASPLEPVGAVTAEKIADAKSVFDVVAGDR